MNNYLYTPSYELTKRLYNSPLYKRLSWKKQYDLYCKVMAIHRARYIDCN